MFDFENYKKLITSLCKIVCKKVLVSDSKTHRMTGSVIVGHCEFKIVVECTNYGNYAGMKVDFIFAKANFNFLDKEFQTLRFQLSNALRPYNASNNGVFIAGGGFCIESESQSFWGLSFNDLKKTDPINNKCANDAISCVNSAIDWLFDKEIYNALYCLYNYFREKKLLLN